jgi:Holliday junction resolvase
MFLMNRTMRKILTPVFGLALLSPNILAQEAIANISSLRLLPAETDSVIQIKMKDMMASPIIQKYAIGVMKEQLAKDGEFQEVIKATGLDITKDIETVTVGSDAVASMAKGPGGKPKVLGVVSGKFDSAKLNAAAKKAIEDKKAKVKISDVAGKTFYEFEGQAGGEPMFASIVSDNQILFGSTKESIQTVIDGKATGPKSEELANIVNKLDSKSMVRIVALTKGHLENLPIPEGDESMQKMKKLLPKVENLVVEIKMATDAELNISFGSDSKETAQSLSELLSPYLDQAKGMAPLLVGQMPQVKPLLEVVNSLKVEAKDKSTQLSATMKESVLQKMMEKK